jgi:hypothetical protein
VFWDKGIASSKINSQLCVQNIKRMGQLSGFQLIEVNLTNIHQYLDAPTLQKINFSLKNAKLNTYAQSQGVLY